MQRPRSDLSIRIGLIVVAIVLGLGSRRFGARLPGFVAEYTGDTLWAFVVFLGVGLVLPQAPTRTVALAALTLSIMIEVSQLYHAPWIDHLRSTKVGSLVLGQGFLWSDIACYAVGIGLGVLLDQARAARRGRPRVYRS